jgi:hypothetical protein
LLPFRRAVLVSPLWLAMSFALAVPAMLLRESASPWCPVACALTAEMFWRFVVGVVKLFPFIGRLVVDPCISWSELAARCFAVSSIACCQPGRSATAFERKQGELLQFHQRSVPLVSDTHCALTCHCVLAAAPLLAPTLMRCFRVFLKRLLDVPHCPDRR